MLLSPFYILQLYIIKKMVKAFLVNSEEWIVNNTKLQSNFVVGETCGRPSSEG